MTDHSLRVRRLAAGVLGVVAFLPVLIRYGDGSGSVWLPLAGLVVAAGLIHAGSLGAQLFARAVWWANLLLGLLLSVADAPHGYGAWIGICCAAALLVAGDQGLHEARERSAYAPAMFIGTLTVAMLLALADTLSLLLFSAIHLEDGKVEAVWLLLASAAMIAGFVGLYRIRAWGVVANIVTNVVVAVWALSGMLDLPDEIEAMLVATAALQLVVPAPIVYALVRGVPPKPLLSARARRLVARAVVVLVACSAFVVYLFRAE